jgi:hypothetical protein
MRGGKGVGGSVPVLRKPRWNRLQQAFCGASSAQNVGKNQR